MIKKGSPFIKVKEKIKYKTGTSWFRFYACLNSEQFAAKTVLTAADIRPALVPAMSKQAPAEGAVLTAAGTRLGAQCIGASLDYQFFTIYDGVCNLTPGVVIYRLYGGSCHIHLLGAITLG
jgi:hypothetical protein